MNGAYYKRHHATKRAGMYRYHTSIAHWFIKSKAISSFQSGIWS